MSVLLAEDGTSLTDETADRFRLLLEPGDPVVHGNRRNFLMSDWYFNQQDDWQDVIDFAEGRTDDLFV